MALKNRFGAWLLVDEAHSVGVLGRNGRGLADTLRLNADVEIQMGTLGKALGASGGYIAGSRRLIELLINRARSFVYSTAPPPACAAAACAAIGFMLTAEGEKRRERLWENLAFFGAEMPLLFNDGRKIQSAVIPVILGDSGRALEAADRLAEHGFYVPAIRHPTVPKDRARLRITISARHTAEQIRALCRTLRTLLPQASSQ